MDYTEKKLRRLNTYEGIIINVGLDRVRLPDGSEAFREIVEHPGGACILPVDGEGNAYCVRQLAKDQALPGLQRPDATRGMGQHRYG